MNVPKVQAGFVNNITRNVSNELIANTLDTLPAQRQSSTSNVDTATRQNPRSPLTSNDASITVTALEVDSDDDDDDDVDELAEDTSRNSSVTSYGSTETTVNAKYDGNKGAVSYVEYVEFVHAIDAPGDADCDQDSPAMSVEPSPTITESPPCSARDRGMISWHTLDTIEEVDMTPSVDELFAYKAMTQVHVVDIKLTPNMDNTAQVPVIIITPAAEDENHNNDVPKYHSPIARQQKGRWASGGRPVCVR